MILADTNAWIAHLRKSDPRLAVVLREGRVRTCDVVLGELLLGSGLPPTFAKDLGALSRVPSPTAADTRVFVERHRSAFSGSGVGWADAQILLAAAKSGARLFTSDRAMARVASRVGVPRA
ncbi:MAG TPA: PIN domain-containing protein [Polyangiaceae bacterium]|nr:PIN domain-containing protein [Polyangiaceae bacterium]